MGDRIDRERLLDWLEGRVDADEAARIEAAVAERPALARTASAWRTARRAVIEDDSVAPSAELIGRLRGIFVAAPAPSVRDRVQSVADALAAIVGSIVFDGRRVATGLRSPQASVDRFPLVAEADVDGTVLEVEIEVERRPDGRRRLLAQASEPASILRVLADEAVLVEVAIGEGGVFDLLVPADADRRRCGLALELELASGRRVRFEEIDLS